MSRLTTLFVLLSLGATACKEQPAAQSTDPTQAIPSPAEPAPAMNVNTNVERNVPAAVAVKADFEEQAIAGITEENLDAEIESLDKELGQ